MRKFTFFVFMMCSFVYAQNYTNKANRKSAERCLKVAENYLILILEISLRDCELLNKLHQ